ncbi:hypothetical protein GFS24_03615 [Chitinophaga sp. SYP-B3965]|nr:hypothetical protein [Chitinophaga sp. SYP-B3965]
MKPFLLVLFFTSIIMSCNSPKPKFGKEYNDRRTKYGVQILPDDWKVISITDEFVIWKNPALDKEKATFFSKTVSYEKGEWDYDEDLFYSGKKFRSFNHDIAECLSAVYYFKPKIIRSEKVKGWYFMYTGPGEEIGEGIEGVSSVDIKMNAQQADSTLRSWGLNYHYK